MSNLSTLFDLIGALARRRFQLGERSFAVLGLNHTEARLLTLLDGQNGEANQDALSNMLSIDRSNAGRALKRLEFGGYVRRQMAEGDRRTRTVQLAPRGQEAVIEIAKLRRRLAETFFGELTEEQAGIILELLEAADKGRPADPSDSEGRA